MGINDYLLFMIEEGASDLHIRENSPPRFRIGKRLVPNGHPLPLEHLEKWMAKVVDERRMKKFAEKGEIDFAFDFQGNRFRANAYKERGRLCFAIRRVPSGNLTFEELNLPPAVKKLASERRGLVLVTGTAGSGKSTTLAAMINFINENRECHIVTIEDPIEVIHEDKKAFITQREIEVDTESYAEALRYVVRQDPDVIMIGEMRDRETVEAAISAAEMGNLVLSTLHTVDATETINRIIDFFQPHEQHQVRIALASVLKGVISQRLLTCKKGGLVPAVEVLVCTKTVSDYIVNPADTYKIKEVIEQGEYYGMQTFEQSLMKLLVNDMIELDEAAQAAENAEDFLIKLRQSGFLVNY
ncbi:MAG: PilT/PilU family type 4a pilus ATPase [Actinobacteria bacterium]|nr:PilT/PilU family type 4a pilus ATPase [Actinomycetota bacterium]